MIQLGQQTDCHAERHDHNIQEPYCLLLKLDLGNRLTETGRMHPVKWYFHLITGNEISPSQSEQNQNQGNQEAPVSDEEQRHGQSPVQYIHNIEPRYQQINKKRIIHQPAFYRKQSDHSRQ
ncbi:hypothetical protein BACCOPRO_02838 [Phocaeicola coprophilus DSM 18228 = JCM 13818]|uniref:Uncharacterized protein n=1 Tax=Phocaeicola coprophilus DSM 18228 = JCM 13818 TaxID=547042 RepID=S0FAD9_9BACT|nr:hypothetical protein BACCOPRO_02838 [Phocaeicola coprophilus DSM 18228 = JCM 13818]